MKKILFVFGTRPEAIKMAPLILEFMKNTDDFSVKICLTGQHRQMLDQVMQFFNLKGDYDLNIMQANQTLFDVTAKTLKGLEAVYDTFLPDYVIVQGDTTTVLAGALAAYYKKIQIIHLEAGLRSGNIYSPFPEEGNRKLVSHIANVHLAPTQAASDNLRNEGITENVFVVGNTVIDALLLGLRLIQKNGELIYQEFFKFLDFSKKIILVTGHRRESFGKPFEDMCHAMKSIAENNADSQIIYPMHLNPHVREPVNRILKDVANIFLIDPLDYPYLIWIMNKSYVVLTDSGGIQEEAPSLGKPVLVMRDVTERQEGIDAGTAKLVGTSYSVIVKECTTLLQNKHEYDKMANAVNPYGDGSTSKKIIEILKNK